MGDRKINVRFGLTTIKFLTSTMTLWEIRSCIQCTYLRIQRISWKLQQNIADLIRDHRWSFNWCACLTSCQPNGVKGEEKHGHAKTENRSHAIFFFFFFPVFTKALWSCEWLAITPLARPDALLIKAFFWSVVHATLGNNLIRSDSPLSALLQ